MQRNDGRSPGDLRPVRMTRRYLKHAHGSCLIELGDTKVLCAAMMSDSVAGWRRGSGHGWITAEYSLLPASTNTRTRREVSLGAPGGRTHEIQRLIGRSLRTIVDMGAMGGEYTLNVDCDVIQADGGTRTAAITGAFIAVHDAFSTWRDAGKIKELPLLDFVAATSVGMVDGVELLDLDYSEDSTAEIDMNVVVDGKGRFIEVQGTGERTPFDRARLDGMLDLAVTGTGRLIELQRRVIAEDIEVVDERW
ncbi:MAG: ribonuclease PH [Actinomycetota bacterium]|nr:ribonuclease PH [Actinomycetota bacterium]MDP3630883.1 ribonuclease PH [Actinomycetota bacterium]